MRGSNQGVPPMTFKSKRRIVIIIVAYLCYNSYQPQGWRNNRVMNSDDDACARRLFVSVI